MRGGLDGGSWGVQQLASLLAGISAYDDESAVLIGAAHRIAEAIDAEVCAVVTPDSEVPVAIGFPAARVPHDALHDVVAHAGGELEVAGLGTVIAEVVDLATSPPAALVLARTTTPLTQDDLHLARSMGQVLVLALELRGAAARERALREQSEQQADALRHANAALQEASRTKDMIISVASHELRTPLTSILGFTSTLRAHGERLDAATHHSYLDIIERQGHRLLRLIDDLLTVGRIEAGRARPQTQAVPVVPALQVLLATTDLDVTVLGLPTTVADVDPGHFDQIVLNLLTNAHKYGAPPVCVEVSERGDRIEIAVVDHGPGVPPSFVGQLFERFSQASSGESRVSSGTGLGLSIVEGLAEANGGQVAYERRDEQTRFTVQLPVSHSVVPSVREEEPARQRG